MVMDKSEPALVPEWLKSSTGISGGGSSSHQLAQPSSSHSDNHSVPRNARNKISLNTDHDIGRSSVLDRTTSAYFRRSFSANGSTSSRSYSSSAKGHRDRDWDRDINGYHDKDRSILGEHKLLDFVDSLDNVLPNMFEKDMLRHSQSMLSEKRGEIWPRKVTSNSSAANKSNQTSGNGQVTLGNTTVIKSTFQHDFPLLGAEERQVGSEIGRVLSPGLATAIHNLPPGTSVVTGSDGWTSALAEVPASMGSSGVSVGMAQQTVSASLATIAPITTSSLNMAETVAQGPSRAHTPPLLNVGTQRLEDLAIKHSRQLIPMTPSVSKPSLVSPSEKSKSKVVQQQYLSPAANNIRGGTARSDNLKTPNESRLRILKPSRELNGVTAKDTVSPTNGSRSVNSPHNITTSASFRNSSNSPNIATVERNPTPLRVNIEKRPTAQAQSRNDFFNLLKKKSSLNSPAAASDPSPVVSPSMSEKSDENCKEDASISATVQGGNAPLSDNSDSGLPTDNRNEINHNNNASHGSQQCSSNGGMHSSPDMLPHPDEEEATFLRSLGWDENAGEGGLTEEEISSFYKKHHMKLRRHAKLFPGNAA